MSPEAAIIDSPMTAETKTHAPSSPLSSSMNLTTGAQHTALSSSQKASAASPSVDLRHVTSSSALSPASARSPTSTAGSRSNRVSQHYPLGSMSPGSIPSSPTSVHSSSSAIFERDIEPLPTSPSNLLSPQSHPHPTYHPSSHNPHHIARGHTTETLEQSVPSVLDSAAEILAQMQAGPGGGDNLIVESPVALRSGGSRDGRSSGWASPRSAGSFRSRSPSPFGSSVGQGSLLLSIPPIPGPGSLSGSPPVISSSPPRPTLATTTILNSNSPSVPLPLDTPTSAYFSTTSSVDGDREDNDDHKPPFSGFDDLEPRTTTREKAPEYPWATISGSAPSARATTTSSSSPSPTSPSFTSNHLHHETSSTSIVSSSTVSAVSSPTSPSVPNSSHSHSTNAAKRLSFLSYTDLLTSTPISTLPLSSFTSAASYMGAEPPHITGVGLVVNGDSQVQPPQPHNPAATTTHSFSSGGSVGSHSPPSPFSTFSFGNTGVVGGGMGQGPIATAAPAAMVAASVPATSKRNSLVGRSSNSGSTVFLDGLVGGEWEREGLGRGLDERLEVMRA